VPHNGGMRRPFAAEDIDSVVPFATVFRISNPHIAHFLGSVGNLAGVMRTALLKSQRVVATVSASANTKGEVAATALFAGAEALIVAYRADFQPLATSLTEQLNAIRAAWITYGETGCWTPPSRVEPPSSSVTALVRVEDPRPLTAGERITAEYTRKAIDGVVDFARSTANSGRDLFGNLILGELPPGGDLTTLIDDAAVDHVKVFATMHTRLAQSLQGYIATVRTSYQGYQDSDLWANPTLTPT